MKKQSKRKPAPKKLKAIQTSRHFRITAHRHTGQVVPRRHTSYPILAMIVLCTGVLLSGWTRMVSAEFNYPDPVTRGYDVHVKVPGPPPAKAATITTPINGSRFSTKPIDVSGTCPKPSYVTILRNNYPSGSAPCNASGKYSLAIDLFPGKNELLAQVYSTTDVVGPPSKKVTVFFNEDKPQPVYDYGISSGGSDDYGVVGSGSASKINDTSIKPLIISTDFKYKGYLTGEWARWDLKIEGGKAPYALAVDWGDGRYDVYSRNQAGIFPIQHQYDKATVRDSSYTVTVSLSDNNGSKAYLQVFTIINNPPGAKAPATSKPDGGLIGGIGWLSSGTLGALIKYAWPAYGIVVLMLVSFWLGERHELKLLQKPRRHRHA